MKEFVFDLNKNSPDNPLISVICINKNHGEYIEENILSVLSQNFESFEFIIADGGSTDDSLKIIGKHRFVKLVSGADKSRIDGLMRALSVARGRYVMVTTTTDGYLSRNWFKTASNFLDCDLQTSLVFGASARMDSQGSLGSVAFPTIFPFTKVPPKEKWSSMWLQKGLTSSYFPELNYCVRIDIFRKLMGPSVEFPELNDIDPILRFHFEFNRLGYLPHYIPTLANFGRTHDNQMQASNINTKFVDAYSNAWKKYRRRVAFGKCIHYLRDGNGLEITHSRVSLLKRILLLLPQFPNIYPFIIRRLERFL